MRCWNVEVWAGTIIISLKQFSESTPLNGKPRFLASIEFQVELFTLANWQEEFKDESQVNLLNKYKRAKKIVQISQ